MSDKTQPSALTQQAIDATLAAAKEARARQLGDLVVEQKTPIPGDKVTDGDFASQNTLFNRLPTEDDGRPIGFMGEEKITNGYTFPPLAMRRWVVDPIDGTKAYANKEHYWSVSVALQRKAPSGAWTQGGDTAWESETGIIYRASAEDTAEKLQGKLYWAEQGKGAYVIDLKDGTQRKLERPAVIQPIAEMESTPECGTDAAKKYLAAAKAILDARGISGNWRRSLCHAGMECVEGEKACLALGTYGPHEWDVAALDVIAREAGMHAEFGPVTMIEGKPRYTTILAWDKSLFDQLVAAMPVIEQEKPAARSIAAGV